MIKTLTLNPAIDKTIFFDAFNMGDINIIGDMRLDAGGKGINVSKVLKIFGKENIACGILGKENGTFFKKYLDSLDIVYDFIEVEGSNRTNIKIIDEKTGTTTDINERGLNLIETDFENLKEKLFCENADVMVFSGGLPQGFSDNTYQKLIVIAKSKNIRTVLDADNQGFINGIKALPDIIKPNIAEFKRYFRAEINTEDEIKFYAEKLIDTGIKLVAVSLGERGAVFVQKDCALVVDPIKVKVNSTVGAGDTMVAVLTMALEENWDLERTAKLAVAASAAAVSLPGTQAPDIDLIKKLEKDIKFRYL